MFGWLCEMPYSLSLSYLFFGDFLSPSRMYGPFCRGLSEFFLYRAEVCLTSRSRSSIRLFRFENETVFCTLARPTVLLSALYWRFCIKFILFMPLIASTDCYYFIKLIFRMLSSSMSSFDWMVCNCGDLSIAALIFASFLNEYGALMTPSCICWIGIV